MSTKVSSDETAIENVSIQNRPMNIQSQYNELTSGVWLEAKQAIDQLTMEDYYTGKLRPLPEVDKLNYMCEIFFVS